MNTVMKFKGREKEYRREASQKWRDQHREESNKYAREYLANLPLDKKLRKNEMDKKRTQRYRREQLEYRLGGGGKHKVPIEIIRQLLERATRCEVIGHGFHKDVLCIHHINGNHEDNRLCNLFLCCSRHHQMIDPMERDEKGRFIPRGCQPS